MATSKKRGASIWFGVNGIKLLLKYQGNPNPTMADVESYIEANDSSSIASEVENAMAVLVKLNVWFDNQSSLVAGAAPPPQPIPVTPPAPSTPTPTRRKAPAPPPDDDEFDFMDDLDSDDE